jgi:alpha-beta hydrolase superfamily lysophospholipase
VQRAEAEAVRAGAALTGFLDSLEAVCPARRLEMTAHSLGSRVALHALARRAAASRSVLDRVALVAPAVPLVDVLPDGALHDGVAGTRRLLVFHNSEDYVQGVLYPLLARGRRSIGQDGLRSALQPLAAVARARGVALREIDAAPLWGPRHSALANLDARFFALFLRESED